MALLNVKVWWVVRPLHVRRMLWLQLVVMLHGHVRELPVRGERSLTIARALALSKELPL